MPESPRALCALTDAKAYLKIEASDTGSDSILFRLIDDASQALHEEGKREFVAIDATGSFAGGDRANPSKERAFDVDAVVVNPSYRTLAVGDLATFTSAKLERDDGTLVQSIAAGDVIVLPRVRQPWEPITRLRFRSPVPLTEGYVVKVTGSWGFPAIPGDLRQAAIVTVNAWFTRDVALLADTVVLAEGQVEVPRELPRQAFDVAKRYRRTRSR